MLIEITMLLAFNKKLYNIHVFNVFSKFAQFNNVVHKFRTF